MDIEDKLFKLGGLQKEIRTHNQFLSNVNKYKKSELEAGERLCKYFKTTLKAFNNDNKYDIILENGLLYESKYDSYFDKYDHVYIECFRTSKPSGILTSISNYYVITDGSNYYLINIKELLSLCKKHDNIKKLKFSYGYIIPKDEFIVNSVLI